MKRYIKKFLSIVILVVLLSDHTVIAYADQILKPTMHWRNLEQIKSEKTIVVSEYRIEYKFFDGKVIPDRYINVTVWSDEFNCFMKGSLRLYSYTYYPFYGIVTLANYVGYVFAVI